MNRFNPFYLVHKGLRALLYDTSLTLQQTDFADSAEAAIALEKVNDVLFVFERHAYHEDKFMFPLVEVYDAELATDFEQQHVEDHRLSDNLKNLLAIYENALVPEEKAICGSAIIKSFTEFLVFNLVHMGKEERLINQALWKHYTDEQILERHKQLLAAIPPAEMQTVAKWMVRGMSNRDAVNWLKDIQHSTPVFVFNAMKNMAANELGEARFATVQEELEEAVLV